MIRTPKGVIMTDSIHYTFIFLCFAIGCCRRIPSSLIVALGFTLAADYFLIFTDTVLPGLLLFTIVHICYLRYLKGELWILAFAWGMGIFLTGSLNWAWVLKLDPSLLPAGGYAACLLCTLGLSLWRREKVLAASIGLLLLCDLHVGIHQLDRSGLLPHVGWLSAWYAAAPSLIWLFYIPAETLLALGTGRRPAWHSLSSRFLQ